MCRRWIWTGFLLAGIGCNRQDAECLGRIGGLVGHQLGELKSKAGSDAGLNRAMPGYGGEGRSDTGQSNQ
jgi:hypothetical protein